MAQNAPICPSAMKRLLTLLALTASAANAAQPRPEPPNKITLAEMIDIARDICPQNPPIAVMHAAAVHAGITRREEQELVALCAMYHFGKSDAARELGYH